MQLCTPVESPNCTRVYGFVCGFEDVFEFSSYGLGVEPVVKQQTPLWGSLSPQTWDELEKVSGAYSNIRMLFI